MSLFLNPPEAAVVLCVDEKTQAQAVDRTQPVLPLLPGAPQRRTHDYTRHGTTICTPALNLASGLVIDNASTHQTPAIQRWLVAHPRFHVHRTPTYSSWLNLAERWFRS